MVEPDIPVRALAGDISVLGARALAGPGEPVVEERRVLAASDRPEERVADGLAAQSRRTVGRQQEPGRAVLVLDRVVDDRQVHQRHALDAQQHVSRDGVVVQVDDHGVACDLPPRRRLDAGGEAAPRQPVRSLADLLDHLAIKVDVRILVAELHPIDGVAERHDARCLVERPRAVGDVELDLLGGDPSVRSAEHDVARRDDAQRRLAVDVDLVGEESRSSRNLDVDLTGQPAVTQPTGTRGGSGCSE